MRELVARVEHTDSFSLMASLEDESIDCGIVDIAYESLNIHRNRGTTTRLTNSKSSSNEWFDTFSDDDIPRLFAEYFRVLKPGAAFFFFGDEWTTDIVKSQQGIDGNTTRNKIDGSRSCDSGFRYWKNIIWGKTTLDREKIRGGSGYHFFAACERIMFFEKRRGKRKLKLDTDTVSADILPIAPVEGPLREIPDALYEPRISGYPTQKPVELAMRLIEPATKEGDLILDVQCGSGTFGVAAVKLRRRFLGCDIKKTAVELTDSRLEEAYRMVA